MVLIDILEGIPQGKGLDMFEATPVLGADTKVVGTNDYDLTEGSDIIVITAGIARKPGMSRDDLLLTNVKIVGEVAEKSAKLSPKAVMIVIFEPARCNGLHSLEKVGFRAQAGHGNGRGAGYRAFQKLSG